MQVHEFVVVEKLQGVVAQVEVRDVRQQVVDLGVDTSNSTAPALEDAKVLEGENISKEEV